MMLFEDQRVTVTNGKGMLGSNDELVGVAWVLIVVDQVCNKASEDIIELKIALKVG
jgi:hypothetical protein